MLRVALKSLFGHKLRSFLVSFAIVLGVSFIATTLILSDSIRAGFSELFTAAYRQVDFVVLVSRDSPNEIPPVSCQPDSDCPNQDSDGSTQLTKSSLLDDELVQKLSQVEGIALVEPVIDDGALLLSEDNQSLWSTPGGFGPVFSWPARSGGPVSLVDGTGSRPPEIAGEIVIDQKTARDNNLVVGDKVKLESAEFNQPAVLMTIVGIATYQAGGNRLDSFVSLSLSGAQTFFNLDNSYSEINLQVEAGVDKQLVKTRLDQTLSEDFEVVSAEDEVNRIINEVSSGLGFVTVFLLMFAAIAIFVAIFVIQNTFKVILSQRTRELALLRILGASNMQIRRLVIYEALLIGILGSLIGLAVGIGLAMLTKLILAAFDLPVASSVLIVSFKTILVSITVGSSVAVISAFLPAFRAGRVPPLVAISDFGSQPKLKSLVVRTVIGLVISGFGVFSMVYGLQATGNSAVGLTGFGAVFMFIGVTALAPVLARPVAYLITRPLRYVWGMTAQLAYANVRRQPRQVAAVASTLMIGVSLIVLVAVLAGSFKVSTRQQITDSYPVDLTVYSQNVIPTEGPSDNQTVGIIPTSILTRLNNQPQLSVVTAVRYSLNAVSLAPDNQSITLAGVDADSFHEVLKLDFSEGSVANLADGQILVKDTVAEANNWQTGDSISLNYDPAGGVRTYQLGGTFSKLFDTEYIISSQAYLEQIDGDTITYIAIKIAAGIDKDEARQVVEEVIADYSSITVFDQADIIDLANTFIDITVAVFQGLLGLSLVIAISGIVNTLFLSVSERTRELGLLRAVGLTRRQLRRMIRIEAIIIALFGALLGVAMGIFFGWAIIRAMADSGVSTLVIPLTEISIYFLLAVVAGILAAVWPAFRASRLDILKAIAHQ